MLTPMMAAIARRVLGPGVETGAGLAIRVLIF
jgi:hypothetical protein